MEAHSDTLHYQSLVTAFEEAKHIFETAKAQREERLSSSKPSKEDEKATKAAILISYFQYKQALLKKKAEKFRLKSEILKQKSEKLAVRIAKLNLKTYSQSLKKTQEAEGGKKTKNTKKKAHKHGGNHTDMLEKPTSKSKAEITKKATKNEKAFKKALV